MSVPLRWILAAACLGAAVPAAAFVHSLAPDSGACLHWAERTLTWTMNRDGDPQLGYERSHAAVARSFATWEAVDCTDLRFLDQSPSKSIEVGFDQKGANENLVVFRTELCQDVVPADDRCWDNLDCPNRYNCWSWGDTVIGVTVTTFVGKTGQLVDADMEYNSALFTFTDVDGPPCGKRPGPACVSTDLQNTATHEIGHFIGLDHSPVRDAVMYVSASLGETSKRNLNRDDRDGICTIYPIGDPMGSCRSEAKALERGGGGCSSAGPGGAAAALLALAALVWRRRLSRSEGT